MDEEAEQSGFEKQLISTYIGLKYFLIGFYMTLGWHARRENKDLDKQL